MTLVDTNVVVDVLGDDPVWADWSLAQLAEGALRGPLLINEVVFAELSVRLPSLESVDEVLDTFELSLEPTPKAALFTAGKAFDIYKRRGGVRPTVLPDFFIGAHAAVIEVPILTRDPRHFGSYFPSVRLITP